jgi:CheY-specific phosphatase CheX
MAGNGDEATASVADVLVVVRDWTTWYIENELGLDVTAGDAATVELQRVRLRDVTSMVGIGGRVNAFVALSFDAGLIDRISAALTAGIDVSDMDAQELREDAAGEVANTIAGNSTANLADGDQALSLTPPVAFANTKSVCRDRDAICWTVAFQTDGGALDVTVMCGDRCDDGAEQNTGDAG